MFSAVPFRALETIRATPLDKTETDRYVYNYIYIYVYNPLEVFITK